VALVRGNANFRLLWFGQIVSLLGDWFNLIASAALVAILTQSGLAIGGLFVVRMLAPFLISPIAGVITDRYDRKKILIWADVARAITVAGFLFVREPGQIWLLYALTAIQLGISGFFFPARNAILPDIVSPKALGTANALASVTWSVMLALGAALGGLVSGIWGIYPAFVIDILTFVLSAFLIAQISYTPTTILSSADKTLAAALQQYLDGLRYLRQHVDILVVALHKAANALLVASGFQVVQVAIPGSHVWCRRHRHGDRTHRRQALYRRP
jgi:MFS family permease